MPNTSPSNDAFDLVELRRVLTTSRFGHPIEYWPRVTSTNERILDMARRGAPEGTVALADEQTAGRGRRGNIWHSPPGSGIWTSILLRPRQVPLENLPPLTLCAGYAVSLAIEKSTGVTSEIKWPNDILIQNLKVAGLLMETKTMPGLPSEGPCVVLGIGINVNQTLEGLPESIHQTATSLRIATGHSVSRQSLFCQLLEEFEPIYRRFLENGFPHILTEIRPRLAWRGQIVELTDGSSTVKGRMIDIEEDGGLRLDTERQGTVAMYSGSLRLYE